LEPGDRRDRAGLGRRSGVLVAARLLELTLVGYRPSA
jgi:hypothetical protein